VCGTCSDGSFSIRQLSYGAGPDLDAGRTDVHVDAAADVAMTHNAGMGLTVDDPTPLIPARAI
jgi:hypothetical protein